MLLADAYERAQRDEAACEWVRRICLRQGNAVSLLADVSVQREVDVVFLDPMYPEKSKKALAKKDMRLFQQLLGHGGDDEASLLDAAREAAKYRVVVKRPIKGACLAGEKPSFSIKGRSTRFDVYTNRKIG